MRVTVRKWGNSLTLRIPSGLAEDVQISEGTEVDVAVADGQLVVKPVTSEVRLEDLLARFKPERMHGRGFPDDAPRGAEYW